MAFRTEKLIRFAHCDPAGIGFYPRYVELINEVVEDWCARGVGVSYRDLHEHHGLGLPAVRLEVEYMAPSRYGDVLEFVLEVLRIGNSSMTLEVCAFAEGRMRLRGELTVVLASLDKLQAVPIDGMWRSRFERFLASGRDGGGAAPVA
jgi:4-hydroxybenzoyl-CoA thioesterase